MGGGWNLPKFLRTWRTHRCVKMLTSPLLCYRNTYQSERGVQQNDSTGSGYPGQLGSRVRARQPGGRLHKDELLEAIDRVLRDTHIYIYTLRYVYNPKRVVARQLFDPMVAVGQGSCSSSCTTSGRQRQASRRQSRQSQTEAGRQKTGDSGTDRAEGRGGRGRGRGESRGERDRGDGRDATGCAPTPAPGHAPPPRTYRCCHSADTSSPVLLKRLLKE